MDEYRKDDAPQIEQVLGAAAADLEHDVAAALLPSSSWSWEELRAAAMLQTEARRAMSLPAA